MGKKYYIASNGIDDITTVLENGPVIMYEDFDFSDITFDWEIDCYNVENFVLSVLSRNQADFQVFQLDSDDLKTEITEYDFNLLTIDIVNGKLIVCDGNETLYEEQYEDITEANDTLEMIQTMISEAKGHVFVLNQHDILEQHIRFSHRSWRGRSLSIRKSLIGKEVVAEMPDGSYQEIPSDCYECSIGKGLYVSNYAVFKHFIDPEPNEFLSEAINLSGLNKIAKGVDFNNITYEDIENFVSPRFPYITLIELDTGEKTPLIPSFEYVIDSQLSDEIADIHNGFLWTEQLQNFIDNGKWFLKYDADGNSKLFFGLNQDDQHEEWTLGEDGLPALQYESRINNDNIFSLDGFIVDGMFLNYNLLFPDDLYWYFWENSYEGADPSRVIKTCPIDLNIFDK